MVFSLTFREMTSSGFSSPDQRSDDEDSDSSQKGSLERLVYKI